jgi:hypothetical protein
LQGAVRLQGLASSPTPDTQVRVACAWAGLAMKVREMASAAMVKDSARNLRMAGLR